MHLPNRGTSSWLLDWLTSGRRNQPGELKPLFTFLWWGVRDYLGYPLRHPQLMLRCGPGLLLKKRIPKTTGKYFTACNWRFAGDGSMIERWSRLPKNTAMRIEKRIWFQWAKVFTDGESIRLLQNLYVVRFLIPLGILLFRGDWHIGVIGLRVRWGNISISHVKTAWIRDSHIYYSPHWCARVAYPIWCAVVMSTAVEWIRLRRSGKCIGPWRNANDSLWDGLKGNTICVWFRILKKKPQRNSWKLGKAAD